MWSSKGPGRKGLQKLDPISQLQKRKQVQGMEGNLLKIPQHTGGTRPVLER